MAQTKRDTYKYQFKVGNKIVGGGYTNHLQRREIELQKSGKVTTNKGKQYPWVNGKIVQVGRITTKEAAEKWKKDNGY